MAKLCYKVNGTVKKYDLKDNANKPRLAVKTGGTTKYLGLKQGTNSGELSVKVGGQILSIKTWGIDSAEAWRGMYPEEPLRGMGGHRGDTTYGGLGIWVLVNEDNYPVVAFGRAGADRPDDWAKAIWYPSMEGTDLVTRFPNNFRLTAEQVTHPKRLKPNIRLATIVSAASPTKAAADQEDLNSVTHGSNIANAVGHEDLHSTRNRVIIKDVVNSLLTYAGNYHGFSKAKNISGYYNSPSNVDTYNEHFGYGYSTLNTVGVYYPNGSEEHGGNDSLPDRGPGATGDINKGIDSSGFKYLAPAVTKVMSSTIASLHGYSWDHKHFALITGKTAEGLPCISMTGVSDDSTSYTTLIGKWGQRDFYIEFPYAWGEDTNPNNYFTFTPKQLLNAVLAVATEKGVANYDYGFVRGRNY